MQTPVKTTTKAVQGTVSVADASRNEAIERLNNYFNQSITTQEFAKYIRKAVFSIQELQSLTKNDPCTYEEDLPSVVYFLNDFVETIDPYFTEVKF